MEAVPAVQLPKQPELVAVRRTLPRPLFWLLVLVVRGVDQRAVVEVGHEPACHAPGSHELQPHVASDPDGHRNRMITGEVPIHRALDEHLIRELVQEVRQFQALAPTK